LGSYAGTVERRMVIECDGFDFHDRTRQQASRDRTRDRWLQSFGILVYRYTGGDIWADVFRHAEEADRVLMKALTDD
jgi:very-short-patch-repair endonuclease